MNINVTNKLWAQQVIASMNQQQLPKPLNAKDLDVSQQPKSHNKASFENKALCRSLDETVTIAHSKEIDS